jgi:alpha-L-rhamnosidase
MNNGATTLYENWNISATRDLSMNHIMFGEIGAWMYKGMGGIYPDENSPGFKNILLRPNFVVDSFEASHVGPHGTIKSSWIKVKKRLKYTVVVPPNSTATFTLPEVKDLQPHYNGKRVNDRTTHLDAGTYLFEWK